MSSFSVHDEWLSLIEISGPFLAVPVLKEVFPQGLEELDALKRKCLRQAYEEWREALETDDPQFLELHAAWINEVLSRGLELDESGTGDTLKRGDQVPVSLSVTLAEHGVTLASTLDDDRHRGQVRHDGVARSGPHALRQGVQGMHPSRSALARFRVQYRTSRE